MNAEPQRLRWDLPTLGFGVGLRPTHYPYIREHWPAVDWFEVISENFMGVGGNAARMLDLVRERYPVVLHGVSMSIGSTDPLDRAYLRQLKALIDRVQPVFVSDHCCWTGVRHRNQHELIPLPYTEATLRHVVRRVREVQDTLERVVFFEDPSSYLGFVESTMPEWEFLARVAEDADCGILLDLNNVYVAAFNHGWDADAYLAGIPHDRVGYYHLAGHTNHGTHCIDTHIGPVIDPVLALFAKAWAMSGGRSTALEWDQEIPEFPVVHAELLRAKRWVSGLRARRARPPTRRRAGITR